MAEEQLDQWYDEDYFDQYPKHERRIRQIVDHTKFEATDSVCEFGCGLGHILLAIADRIHHGTGIDVSEYACSTATAAAEKSGIRNLDFRSLDIIELRHENEYSNQFHKVLMMDISEHLYDDTLRAFFDSAKSVLKPRGQLILHTPNAEYILERMKARNFILKQFESHIAVRSVAQHIPILEAAGFSQIDVQFLPHHNRILNLLDRVLMHVPIVKRFFRARILLSATLE